jgi:S-DNA-T family DNA segregation ATPase FtsK/SpoIIIE
VGIEVPNKSPEMVSMRSLITSKAFQETKYDIAIALGRTITNEPYIIDLTKMPHLLVAGATGQGKSVGINAIISSILFKKHPAELKLVLIDPKRVELPLYAKIERHFLAKLPGEEDAIITDTQKVIKTLNSLCIEMDNRLELLKMAQARHIKEYNEKFISRKLSPEKGHKYLPYIVLIIDEFADLIMTAGREIEGPIGRLAQLARAIGIHLIISTQRPSTNIITGYIKANFPTRIAFRVFSSIDSRTILDATGAVRLVGRGDLLISSGSEPVRVQCAFIDTPEIEDLTEFIGSQRGYPDAMHLPECMDDNETESAEVDLKKRDPMFEQAAKLIVQHQQGSTSLIQRKLGIGYNRAGRIIDQLEAAGVVGAFDGSKARDVLCQDFIALEQILKQLE